MSREVPIVSLPFVVVASETGARSVPLVASAVLTETAVTTATSTGFLFAT